MINELSHSLLTDEELSMTGKRIAGLTEKAGLGLSYVDGLVDLVKANVDDLHASQSRSKALELTPDVQAADNRRDTRYRSFRGFIDHKRYSADEGVKKQADYVWTILDRHGLGLWYLGMTDQSAALNNLFAEIDNDPKAKDALTALGADGEYSDVKKSQSDFETIYRLRVSEASKREDDPRMGNSRRKLTENLQALLVNIEMAQKINRDSGEEFLSKIKSLVNEVNNVIASAMSVARARVTRSESAKDAEDKKSA